MVDFWLDAIAVEGKGKAQNTLDLYRRAVEGAYLPWLEQRGIEDLEDVTANDIRTWIAGMLAAKSKGTAATYFNAAKGFYRWLEAEREITVSPFKNVKAPQVTEEDEPDRHIINPPKGQNTCPICNRLHYLDEVLDACEQFGYLAVRNRAIVLMLMETGVRADELASMELRHTDMKNGETKLTRSKSKLRTVSFGNRTRQALDRYVRNLRNKAAKPGVESLFVTNAGDPIRAEGVLQIIRAVGDAAGISGLHPHCFRHSAATMYGDNGMSPVEMNRLFGWSPTSTMVYKYTKTGATRRTLAAQRQFSSI